LKFLGSWPFFVQLRDAFLRSDGFVLFFPVDEVEFLAREDLPDIAAHQITYAGFRGRGPRLQKIRPGNPERIIKGKRVEG
jgi:hypothetical protein